MTCSIWKQRALNAERMLDSIRHRAHIADTELGREIRVLLAQRKCADAEDAILDGMAQVPEHWLRLDVGGEAYALVRQAELARRGLK